MAATTTLTMADGIRIVVPASFNCITTYVVCEQGDWFEDEVRFLRRLLQPGQCVIDIGANYGAYTLSMAKLVGAAGRVWAFEPASDTARHLRESVAANQFTQVSLIQCALSDTAGTAKLSLKGSSELNELVRGEDSAGNFETVTLTTLDNCMTVHGWHDVAFLKLDAEGEEANIVRGGGRFLVQQSPLIQYEVKARASLNLELVQIFNEFGYASYRLVPGLNVLVPFDQEADLDRYTLNLFGCKAERATQLSDLGFLARMTAGEEIGQIVETLRIEHGGAWLKSLLELPYGRMCMPLWRDTVAKGWDADVEAALSLYDLSRRTDLPANVRFEALRSSFTRMKKCCAAEARPSRLATLARVALDYGARSVAIQSLNQLAGEILKEGAVDLGEPFLPPCGRFDVIPSKDSQKRWLAAATMEALEKYHAYSSIFSGQAAWPRLDLIRQLGYGSEEMNRRWQLIGMLCGSATGVPLPQALTMPATAG